MAAKKGPKVEKTEQQKADALAAKLAKFEKLAKARTARAIKSISLIQNLAGSGYHSTERHARQIVKALRSAVDDVETRLNKVKKGVVSAFDFSQETE